MPYFDVLHKGLGPLYSYRILSLLSDPQITASTSPVKYPFEASSTSKANKTFLHGVFLTSLRIFSGRRNDPPLSLNTGSQI